MAGLDELRQLGLLRLYGLNEQREPVACDDARQWAAWMQAAEAGGGRRVGDTEAAGGAVSTGCLGQALPGGCWRTSCVRR